MYNQVKNIFFSPTHTSRQIAAAVAGGTGLVEAEPLDLTFLSGEKKYSIQDTLAIVAVPVYAGRIPAVAARRLAQIEARNCPCAVIAVYGNRDYDDALLELRNILTAQGFIPVGAAAFIGEHSYSTHTYPIAAGRPDAADLKKAAIFGSQITAALQKLSSLEQTGLLHVKGNDPYKPYHSTPATPVTAVEKCSECGYCIDICPVDAIRREGGITSDPERCIKCCACVKECPRQARIFNTPYSALLHQNCSVRKEPEWIICDNSCAK